MIEMDAPSYNRTPSPALRQLLAGDGFLEPLLRERTINGRQNSYTTPGDTTVLLEIKDASGSASEIYYAPFQLLQNVWEWKRALPAVRGSLQRLLDARVELGLTPGGVPRITGGVRAAIGFGADERSERVRSRYSEVLGIVNAQLPPGVSSIETWAFVNGEPICQG